MLRRLVAKSSGVEEEGGMAKTAARLIVGISGASGTVYGVRILELLRNTDIETHLVMSKSAEMTLAYETDMKAKDIRAEKRRLVLAVRETPLHGGHLRTMTTLSDIGAVIAPIVPAFYNRPETVDDIINHTVGRLLDLFGIDTGIVKRWKGGGPAEV
jgi:4-hydroxy-3-polyprenylbenzoate decarboxylase